MKIVKINDRVGVSHCDVLTTSKEFKRPQLTSTLREDKTNGKFNFPLGEKNVVVVVIVVVVVTN